MNYRIPRVVALTLLAAMSAVTQRAVAASEEPTTFDKLWDHAVLYKDNTNPILEEFKLRGRYQGQYHAVKSVQGDDDTWEDRRSRFGFDAKLFNKKVEIRADFQSNDHFEDFYDGLVDAYIRWKPVSWLGITAGKTKPLIGQFDWLESTNTQPTFERSQIFNQLGINRTTAITVEGTADAWSWRAGVYSNDTPNGTGNSLTKRPPSGTWGDGEFGHLDGGFSYSAGVGYDFKSLLNLEKADFRFDWLHSDRQVDSDLVLNKYDDILASTLWLKQDAASLVVEGYYATGASYKPLKGDTGNGDVFGFFIEPRYDIIPEKLQIVGRYSFATGNGDVSLSAQSRYEQTAPDIIPAGKARGDLYQSIYLGFQYFIYGDKFKLLGGAEYAHLTGGPATDDYEGVTWLTGVRFSF